MKKMPCAEGARPKIKENTKKILGKCAGRRLRRYMLFVFSFCSIFIFVSVLDFLYFLGERRRTSVFFTLRGGGPRAYLDRS